MDAEAMYWQSVSQYSEVKNKEIPPDELHLCFNFEPENLDDFLMVCRKGVLYGTHSYFVLPWEVRCWSTSPEIDEYTFAFEPADRHYDMDPRFIELWMGSRVYHEYVTLLPESTNTPFRSGWEIASMLNVKFRHTFLKRQLLERDVGANEGVEFFLPHLRGVSDEELLKIRSEEYHDSFHAFQGSLTKLLGSTIEDDERSLYGLMQEVDENVKRLSDTMSALKRRRWFDAMEMALIPLPRILFFVPSIEVRAALQVIFSTIGGATALDYARSIRDRLEVKASIRSDAFFIPWHLTRSEHDRVE
jgi:hypothetical protein